MARLVAAAPWKETRFTKLVKWTQRSLTIPCMAARIKESGKPTLRKKLLTRRQKGSLQMQYGWWNKNQTRKSATLWFQGLFWYQMGMSGADSLRFDHEHFSEGEGFKHHRSKEYSSGLVSTVVSRGRCFSVRHGAASGLVYCLPMVWVNVRT